MARHMRSEMLEILRGIPLFAHLPNADLREVARLCIEEFNETREASCTGRPS
jgi:hypothetical protein